jgi:hypothetical protein
MFNKRVTLPMAMLLKEKGYDKPCLERFDDNGIPVPTKLGMHGNPNNYSDSYSAPTIGDVIEWFYAKHGLWINCMYMGFELKYSWSVDVITTFGSNWDSFGEEGDTFYYSPIEGYEAAINYCLNELI